MRLALFAMLLAFCVPAAYGDGSASLWIPQHMIAGQTYQGVLVVSDATAEGSVAFLSTQDELVAQTPHSVSVLPYQNHGIFPIVPHASGDARIFATLDGYLHEASARVFSPGSEPARLGMVVPANTTKADSMLAYVTLHDENGSLVPADADMQVHLATSQSIGAPPHVIIKNGTTHAKFGMHVDGTGHVTASASTLAPHTAHIKKVQDGFSVQIAVAPEIAMEDSYAYYYVWLEKDGSPLRLPYVVDVSVHSSNPDVARLVANPHVQQEIALLHLVDGIGRGTVYTGERGLAKITASVADIGTAHDALFVGPAKVEGIGEHGLTVNLHEQNLLHAEDDDYVPNMILSWVYPSVTDRQVWGVAATYHVNKTVSVEQDIDGSGAIANTISEGMVITPAIGHGLVHVSSGHGLEHKGTYVIDEGLAKTNSIEFEMAGSSYGQYNVTVSGSGMESAEAQVDVVSPHTQDFGLSMVAVPALPNTRQDVAIVSILDEAGTMIDPEVYGDVDILLSAGSSTVPEAVQPTSYGSAIVNAVLSESDTISAVLGGAGSAEVDVAPAKVATSLELLVPPRVHVSEAFPFAIHHTDHNGTPLQKADIQGIFSPLGIAAHGDTMTLGSAGTSAVSAVSPAGVAESEIAGFENIMHASLDLAQKKYRVGQTLVLEVLNSVDAQYSLLTDYPFEQTASNAFAITLDEENKSAEITVIASREGYSTVSISETINVEEIVALDVRTAESGNRLSVPLDVIIGDDAVSVQSPYHAEFRPDEISVILPEKVTIHGRGYSFDNMQVNGVPADQNRLDAYVTQDIEVVADYTKEILIDVIDGEGSGVYGRGQTVTASAPDREILSFLVRDTFDHWVGLDADTSVAVFAAERDVVITAVYREDHTYLMMLVIVPLSVASVLVLLRKMSGLRWATQNLLERIYGNSRILGKGRKQARKLGVT